MTADLKSFKLKARGDGGSGRSELLEMFEALARSFGMTTHRCDDDHHLIVTSTAEQRLALFRFNRRRTQNQGMGHSPPSLLIGSAVTAAAATNEVGHGS
jgi:hypothetical protein